MDRFLLAWLSGLAAASAFSPRSSFISSRSLTFGARFDAHHRLRLENTKTSWSAEDDWSTLSWEHPENATPNTDDLFNTDLAARAAHQMEGSGSARVHETEEDTWLRDVVDLVQNHGYMSSSSNETARLYDTGFESHVQSVSFQDEMGQEISMLVNCNTSPEDMLVKEGRVLPPLTDEERNDPSQLVHKVSDGTWEATVFFREAVSTMFHSHATYDEKAEQSVMDASSASRWMTKCLWLEERQVVSAHDKRILSVMSKYGTHGTGYLTEDQFQELYMDAVVSSVESLRASRHSNRQLLSVECIFRDLHQHGIVTPLEFERKQIAAEMREKHGSASAKEAMSRTDHLESLLDECEILEWEQSMNSEEEGRKSSYELVEMASDGKTPLRMRDGEFVFVDEESCIGCAQCVSVAPSAFVMLESGRARMFDQSRSPDVPLAVSVCPVSCMHNMAFHELKEMEDARDRGDGRTDHRHMGQPRGHTPLSVAGIDSDANHKSSWYHYLKHKCNGSSDCPKRGCFDCPSYAPGENPYFKTLQKEAEHVRADDLIANGSADLWRKTADL